MQELQALNNLLSTMYKKDQYEKELEQQRILKREKEKSLRVNKSIPEKGDWEYKLTFSSIFFGIVGGIGYVVLYIITVIISGFSRARFWRTSLYYMVRSATWIGGLIFSRRRVAMRSLSLRNADSFRYLVELLIGIVISVLAIIVVCFVIDSLIAIIRKPIVKKHNKASWKSYKDASEKNDMLVLEWKHSRDFSKRLAQIDSLNKKIAYCKKYINEDRTVHKEFKSIKNIELLIYYIETNRAKNLTDAINKMDDYAHKQRMESLEEARLYEEERTRIAAEKAEIYARQTAYNSSIAADEAERAADEAERAADYEKARAWIEFLKD